MVTDGLTILIESGLRVLLGASCFALSAVRVLSADAVAQPSRELRLGAEFATLKDWWSSNGGEFPGATGSIGVATTGNKRCLRLAYDFSGGGSRSVPNR